MATDTLIKDINSGVAKLNEMTKGTGLPTVPTIKPITPQDLTETVKPFPTKNLAMSEPQLPQLPTQPGTAPAPDLAQQQIQQRDALAGEKQNAWDAQIESILNAPTQAELQAQQYQQFGVDEKQLAVNQYQTQILAEQDKLRKFKEDILSQGGGVQAGAQSEIANAERDSYRRQSDLALLQLAAQNQLQFATQQADRAVDAMFSRVEKIQQLRRDIYNEVKSQWSEADRRAFELAEADRERKLQNDKEAERLLQNTKIETLQMLNLNDAPEALKVAVAQAETPEDVITAAGQYGSVDILDQQYKKIRNAMAAKEYDQLVTQLSGQDALYLTPEMRTKIAAMPESKEAQTLLTLNANLSRLQQLYDTYGTWNPINREAAKSIASLRAQLEIDIAVAGGQGAISKEEADRYSNIVGGSFFERGKNASNSIKEAIRANDQKISDKIKFVQSAIPGASLFEPFAQFIENKEAEDYIEQQIGVLATNDGEAIDMYINSFTTANSTQSK